MKYDTIREAAEAWVEGFSAIPSGIVQKLVRLDDNEFYEVTPPSKSDRIYIWNDDYQNMRGEILSARVDEDTNTALYKIRLDGEDEEIELPEDEFEVTRDDWFPMWGTMWAFGEGIDNWWLREDGGLQLMADCGFRIYEQEDYEYVFGIDGAGYDFYESHWIPLYKARGLHWHKEEPEEVSA